MESSQCGENCIAVALAFVIKCEDGACLSKVGSPRAATAELEVGGNVCVRARARVRVVVMARSDYN